MSSSSLLPASSAATSASVSDLVETLSMASSQSNSQQVKLAEERLRGWENAPGFYSALMDVVTTSSQPTPVRWQAVLYVKNGVDRYWRKMAPNALSEEEKKSIRAKLLLTFSEPVQQIALQNAVLIGKAARYDVPRDWPELLPCLFEAVRSSSDIVQHRSLLVLHHTIKSLSSKRLAADRRVFHDMVLQLLPYVLSIWETHHSSMVQQAAARSDSIAISLEKANLCLKVIRKSIIHGLKKPHENAEAMLFLSSLLQQTRITLNLRCQCPALRDAFEKYLVLHLKTLSDLLDGHPFSFLPLLRNTLEFVCNFCFTAAGEGLMFQRFTIFCLNLMKQVLLCMEYKPPKSSGEVSECSIGTIDSPLSTLSSSSNNSLTMEGHRIKQEFFDAATSAEICRRLISHYLPLSQEDLALWDADPEEYACEDGGDSWKYSYRPCCETAFVTLFHEHRNALCGVLVKLLQDNSNLNVLDVGNLSAILYKDAVYNAVGLVAFDLYEEIDFDQWLLSGLEAELAVKESNYRIVRRRVVWLLGQWSGVKLSPQLRPKLYHILLPLLQSGEDLVVRLSAAKALKVVIDDFEFSSEELEPYLATAFQQLFLLLKEVQECDTKLSALNVLSYLVERMGVSIRPFCTELVQYLPALWDASIDHSMLRCSILTTLVFIVQGLGTSSGSLTPFLFPVIRLSTDLGDPSSVYLLEDGLELWLNVLHNTKEMRPELMELANNIAPLLALGSDNLRTMLYILQAYILLSPTEFLLRAGAMINTALQEQYADLQDEGVLLILRLLELAVKAGPPQETPRLFKSLLLCSIRAIYEGDDYPMLMSMHLSIASRLLLSNTGVFNDFTSELAAEVNMSQSDVAGKVLDVWLDKMPCVNQPDRKKLLSLALSSLLTSGSNVVYQRVFGIFLNVTETLNDITRTEEDTGVIVDSLVKSLPDLSAEGVDDRDFETEHDQRRRETNARDPVHTVNLRDFFQMQLVSMASTVGDTAYAEMMANVDIETLENMREFISV